jgi:D-arginine dehydrogenase
MAAPDRSSPEPGGSCDVVVVGGGIAGLTAGAALAEAGASVVVLEREAALAQHTTGRSAAAFIESYGAASVQALTRPSRSWFEERDLLRKRPTLVLAETGPTGDEQFGGRRISVAEAVARFPPLRPGWVAAAYLEDHASDIDVAGAVEAARRQLGERGGTICCGAHVVSLRPGWTVGCADGRSWTAPAVVDAAGAWADDVAALAGARPVGLRPLRRTAFTFLPPPAVDHRDWPLVTDAAERWYLKPEGAVVLGSPADETPDVAGDARPRELDVAIALERINAATTLAVRSIVRAWAGLRTFAPDRTLVIGADPDVSGFHWLAGQGGYGIQTAPTAARLCVAGLTGGPPPVDAGVAAALSPARFR